MLLRFRHTRRGRETFIEDCDQRIAVGDQLPGRQLAAPLIAWSRFNPAIVRSPVARVRPGKSSITADQTMQPQTMATWWKTCCTN